MNLAELDKEIAEIAGRAKVILDHKKVLVETTFELLQQLDSCRTDLIRLIAEKQRLVEERKRLLKIA